MQRSHTSASALTDYEAAISQGDMKARKKSLFGAALLLFLTHASADAQRGVPRVASQNSAEPILLTVTVTNERGEFVTGLKQDNFKVLVDKAPAKIVSFSDSDAPASIGILFDTSGSMKDFRHEASTKLEILKNALARFLELSNKANDYFVLSFAKQPQLLSNWTYDPKTIMEKLGALKPQGNTAFYDACYLGVKKVMEGQYHKRAIILISDGQDNESHYTYKQLRELVKESNTLVYSVNVLINDYVTLGGGATQGVVTVPVRSLIGADGQQILNELGWISGGMAFYQEVTRVKPAEVKAFFEVIANELRHQYVIGIMPADSAGPHKWRKIRINVSSANNASREMKGLSVRTREGYYTPK